MSGLAVRALTLETWPAFAALVEKDGGIFGGCWCLGFHAEGNAVGGYEARRDAKAARVARGEAHAALVLDDTGACLGWAQFGPPAELPNIKSRKAYEAKADRPVPDWRFACLYTGKGQRGRGVSRLAVEGALDLIAAAGGGMVEAYPEATAGRKAPGAFLFNGALELFESLGFVRDRPIAKHRWVVSRQIEGVRP
jgi:hypothetical protein